LRVVFDPEHRVLMEAAFVEARWPASAHGNR
jgi:hypothetical protein